MWELFGRRLGSGAVCEHHRPFSSGKRFARGRSSFERTARLSLRGAAVVHITPPVCRAPGRSADRLSTKHYAITQRWATQGDHWYATACGGLRKVHRLA